MTLEEFLQEWRDGSPTLLVHTSGSTGSPKPLRVEKQRMLNSARITCDFLGLKPGQTALLCMPLDYIAGKMMVVRSLERQLRLISVAPTGHPLAELPENCTIDFAAMVPLQVYNSLQVPQERERLQAIGHLIIGGGAIDEELRAALASFPNAVWSSYGMTETLSHIALRRLSGPGASSWYRPFPSVKLGLDANGCLVIQAPLVSPSTLVTHDRAELTEDDCGCCFRILGRLDNVICSGGIKLQIEEVEALLRPVLHTPFLLTKRPDRKFGEAAVLLTEAADVAAVARTCSEVLPRFWRPREVLHVECIPLTATGKPARAEAEKLAARLAAAEG